MKGRDLQRVADALLDLGAALRVEGKEEDLDKIPSRSAEIEALAWRALGIADELGLIDFDIFDGLEELEGPPADVIPIGSAETRRPT